MEIAKGVQADDYLQLNLADYASKSWDTAIGYLRSRLIERFIEPIEQLIDAEKNISAQDKKFGFAILALDCLLVETIQSFYEGETNSSGKSTDIFKRFLLNRENFKPYFTTDAEAYEFYKSFRCGILHQAQTGANTKVWAVGNLIMRTGQYVIVNRSLFHENVKKELDIYLNKLIAKNDPVLLDHFKKKMDFIAGRP